MSKPLESFAVPELEVVEACSICGSHNLEAIDQEFNFARCRDCSFLFDSPRPTLKTIIDFYSGAKHYDPWLTNSAARTALYKRRLRKMLKYSRPGTLLDIGCGIGEFLELARPHFTEVTGTEISRSGATLARARGLKVLEGEAEVLSLPKFDNITLLHVLEHVPDPMRTIRRCWELLNSNGMLLICVPNDVQSWTSKLKALAARMGITHRFSPVTGLVKAMSVDEVHLSHFRPEVLLKALCSAGFTVRTMTLDPYYASSGLMLWIHRVYYWLHSVFTLYFDTNHYLAIWAVAYKIE